MQASVRYLNSTHNFWMQEQASSIHLPDRPYHFHRYNPFLFLWTDNIQWEYSMLAQHRQVMSWPGVLHQNGIPYKRSDVLMGTHLLSGFYFQKSPPIDLVKPHEK